MFPKNERNQTVFISDFRRITYFFIIGSLTCLFDLIIKIPKLHIAKNGIQWRSTTDREGAGSPAPFTQRYLSHQIKEPLVFQWDLLSILMGITKLKRVVGKNQTFIQKRLGYVLFMIGCGLEL